MALFDFADTSQDPSQLSLFDRIGLGLSGQPTIDPDIASQLGIDPQAMRRQMAAQALMRFGAGMAQGGAPRNGHTPTIWEAMANGMGAAQGGGQDQMAAMLAQAYKSRQLSAIDAQTKKANQQDQYLSGLRKQLEATQLDPNFVKAMGLDENTLRAMFQNDPEKAQALISGWSSQNAAADRQDARDAAAAERQQRQIDAQEANANRRLQIQLGAQNAMPAVMRYMTPEQRAAYLNKEAGVATDETGKALPQLSPQDKNAVNKDATALQGNFSALDALRDKIADIRSRIATGEYSAGGNAISRTFNKNAPDQLRSDSTVQFDKDLNELVLDYQQTLKNMRGTNMALQQIQASKPRLGMSTQAIDKILSSWDENALAAQSRINDKLEFYHGGGRPADYVPKSTVKDASKGVQSGASTTAGGDKYTVGQTYVDGSGHQARYLGNGKWQEL